MAHAAGDLVFAGPEDGGIEPILCLHVGERVFRRFRCGSVCGRPEEGHDLLSRAGGVGGEVRLVRACRDPVGNSPTDRIKIIAFLPHVLKPLAQVCKSDVILPHDPPVQIRAVAGVVDAVIRGAARFIRAEDGTYLGQRGGDPASVALQQHTEAVGGHKHSRLRLRIGIHGVIHLLSGVALFRDGLSGNDLIGVDVEIALPLLGGAGSHAHEAAQIHAVLIQNLHGALGVAVHADAAVQRDEAAHLGPVGLVSRAVGIAEGEGMQRHSVQARPLRRNEFESVI